MLFMNKQEDSLVRPQLAQTKWRCRVGRAGPVVPTELTGLILRRWEMIIESPPVFLKLFP